MIELACVLIMIQTGSKVFPTGKRVSGACYRRLNEPKTFNILFKLIFN